MKQPIADIDERVMRRLDWALPPEAVEREIIVRKPAEPSQKPPLLFVHGLGHGAWVFDEYWMPELADRGWPCHAVSLRGHGQSESGEQTACLRHYVHDVMQVIIELPEPPVLVGHAAGALVVMRVLERYAARAGIFVAPVPAHGGLGILRRLMCEFPGEAVAGLLGRRLRWRREHLFGDRLDDATARAYLARIEAPTVANQYEVLLPRTPRSSKAPVFVIGSRDDALVPTRDTERTALAYGARLRMFVGMGHDMMLDAGWEGPLNAMDAWLERNVMG